MMVSKLLLKWLMKSWTSQHFWLSLSWMISSWLLQLRCIASNISGIPTWLTSSLLKRSKTLLTKVSRSSSIRMTRTTQIPNWLVKRRLFISWSLWLVSFSSSWSSWLSFWWTYRSWTVSSLKTPKPQSGASSEWLVTLRAPIKSTTLKKWVFSSTIETKNL